MADGSDCLDDGDRNLQLDQHDRDAVPQSRSASSHASGQAGIRIGNNGDVVLAGRGVDSDVGDTGVALQDLDRRRIDTLRGQGPQRQLPKDVIAHCADHVRLRTGAGRRERLVGPLAAQGQTEIGCDHGLAWPGQWRSVGRQVSVDAADNGQRLALPHRRA